MSATPSFLLSLLARQQQLLGGRFFERHPADWLVWEPGPSRPSRILSSNSDSTLNPSGSGPQVPADEDPLCFELKRTVRAVLTVGRGTENDLVLNDLTVSREQFVLQLIGTVWQLRARGTPVTIDGEVVGPAGAPLRNGAVIAAGGARLTFYESEGFPRRLEAESSKRSP